MTIKKFFGTILTLLGIAGLVYTAILFKSTDVSTRDVKTLITFGLLGFAFFSAGIGLVRTINDVAQ